MFHLQKLLDFFLFALLSYQYLDIVIFIYLCYLFRTSMLTHFYLINFFLPSLFSFVFYFIFRFYSKSSNDFFLFWFLGTLIEKEESI